MRMSPLLGSSRPAMQRRIVVLPQPLEPSRTDIAPARNETVKSEITWTLSKDLASRSIATLAADPCRPGADDGSLPDMPTFNIGIEGHSKTARQARDVRESLGAVQRRILRGR